ncbi:MAG: hypothetical protein NUV78_01695 [Candidatus Zambryskibacteria bacterium]|nr:hypothetical protein [Candidatus Zambryskibacteria bacterium]
MSPIASPDHTSTHFRVTVGTEWTEPIPVPLGGRIGFASERDLVQYEVMDPEGKVYAFPTPGNVYRDIPNPSSLRFRSKEVEPVIIRVRVTS